MKAHTKFSIGQTAWCKSGDSGIPVTVVSADVNISKLDKKRVVDVNYTVSYNYGTFGINEKDLFATRKELEESL